ncbi:uncharacterized protein LOC124942247 [Impatiens glandulifera]|uniref:uncharacterized protein LOC124942247 n=1 Tax=Impatiens glandulifera TaxID=253017 RepID=UPI001FB0D75C|nr:uncharacterized protein LOC124942247 [Impatiens glandulifera]
MEKRFRKHPVICEDGQISCMIGLISMLDFRQRRLNQGLISNEKHVNQNDSLMVTQKRSVKALMEEEISSENESFSRSIRYGAHDDYPVFQCSDMERTSHNSDQKCLKPLDVLKMNKELCLKLIQDGNSPSSVRNTKNSQAETGCGFDSSKITYDSLLKKIKNKHGDRSRTRECTVVVLKPESRKVPVSEDVSCNCSINSCKPVPISLKNVKKKKTNQPLEQIHVEKKKTEEDSSQFDIVLEAKKHMSKRLNNLVQDGDVFSSQEPPRTLGRILSLPKLAPENSKTPAVALKMKMKLKDDQSQLFQETPRRKSTNGMEKPVSEEWTSPVSVLEPFFIDNLSSPSTPGSQWGNSSMHLQPHRLDFEEYSTILSSPDLACLDDSDTISNYVKSVLQSRPMNWNDIFLKFDQNSFDEPFFDEMELCKVDSYWQHKLLFDCTNEAFLDVCRSHLGFSSSNLVVWNKLDLFNEINKRVNKQFVPRPMSRTLQDIVGEDLMDNTWKWMDLRIEVEDIAIQVVEFIIAVDLIPDTITEFFHLNF